LSNIIVKKKKGIYVLPLESIIYMEKNLRKICLYTENGQTVEFYGRFEDVLPLLDSRFMFCHRSYIINMDAIVIMTCNQIFVRTNRCIYMGRDTFCKARKIFREYKKDKFIEKR